MYYMKPLTKKVDFVGLVVQVGWGTILRLAFQSIGVVYGDIGTSPLYVYSSTFTDGIKDKDDLLGVLSLIIYTLTLIPLLKYVFIVLWANDNGDGEYIDPASFYAISFKTSNIANFNVRIYI